MACRKLLFILIVSFNITAYAVMVIGHRGACGHEPENTLASFQKAIDLVVDMIELDVHVCKSGEVVVVHDFTIDRTTNGKGAVADLTLEEIKKYETLYGQKIPTLCEVLDLLNRRIKINIELKGENSAEPVAQIIKTYIQTKGWQPSDFFVSSFNHPLLLQFHKFCPEIDRGAIIFGIPLDYAKFGNDLGAQAIVVVKDFINQKLVNDAHERGLKIYVYTVNDSVEIAFMKALKVDGIISNYPDRV